MTACPDRNDAGPVVKWLQSPLAFVVLCVLGALPLAFTAMPPLIDLGGHLGRFAVQLDGGASASLRQWYSFHWDLIPNLGTDLLMQVLAPVLGLEPALKWIVVAIPALQIAGWLLLARAAHGYVPPTVLFAVPLAYSYPFEYGFLNFSLSAALATCFLALWIALGKRERVLLRWMIFVPLACGLWVAHLVGWAIFCVLAGADELWRRKRNGQALGRASLGAITPLSCLLAPWLVKLFWPGAPSGHGVTDELFKIGIKLRYLIMPLRDRWAIWDIASTLALLALISWSWKSDRFTRHGGLALGAACLAGLYFLIPGHVVGSYYADMRLLPTILAIALITMRPAVTARRLAAGLAIAGLVFAGARLAGNAASMVLSDRQFTQDLAVLKVVPRDSQLVSLVVQRCDQTYGPWLRERRSHLGGYAIARRHDFSNDQWLIPGGQLLQVHNPGAGEFASDPSQLTHPLACNHEPGVVQVAQRIPLVIRHLWLLADGRAPVISGWHPVQFSTGSVLYSRNE